MSNNEYRTSLATFASGKSLVPARLDHATDLMYRRLVQSITGYAIYMLDVDGVITT